MKHADPKREYHPAWNSYIFNHSRNEVRAFLMGSAIFWLEEVAILMPSELMRWGVNALPDYARKGGEWLSNKYGGKEDLDAISFIRIKWCRLCFSS